MCDMHIPVVIDATAISVALVENFSRSGYSAKESRCGIGADWLCVSP